MIDLDRYEMQIAVDDGGGVRWVAINGELVEVDAERAADRVATRIGQVFGTTPRVRWKPDGPDSPGWQVRFQGQPGVKLAAGPRSAQLAADVFALLVTVDGMYALAEPGWLINGTAAWRLWPAAIDRVAYVGELDGAASAQAGANPGQLVAWCVVTDDGSYPDPDVQRIALEAHRQANTAKEIP